MAFSCEAREGATECRSIVAIVPRGHNPADGRHQQDEPGTLDRLRIYHLPGALRPEVRAESVKFLSIVEAQRVCRAPPAYNAKPDRNASWWNITTVSSEKSSKSFPASGSLRTISSVTVMMWQPISSAW